MRLEQQLLTNREWTTTVDQQSMKLEHNYWSTENEVRTTPIDQQGMKLEQQLLINREWS